MPYKNQRRSPRRRRRFSNLLSSSTDGTPPGLRWLLLMRRVLPGASLKPREASMAAAEGAGGADASVPVGWTGRHVRCWMESRR